jgi:hypothetical protein
MKPVPPNTTPWALTAMTCIALLVPADEVRGQVTLFADNFDRADNTDLNGSTDGKSGTLGALDWVKQSSAGEAAIDTNVLRIGENGAGGGWTIAYPDHNFTDSSITTGGSFTVSMDLGSPLNSSGGTRFTGFAVGHSKAEMDAWSSNHPANTHVSDFFIGYDTTGTNEVKVYVDGGPGMTQDYQQGINLDATGGTLSATFSVTDFNSGSTVNYEVFINGGSVKTGSFTWSGTNENYLGLYSNYTTNQGLIDNFAITANAPSVPFAITEIDYDADTAMLTLTWTSTPNETYGVYFSTDMTNWESDVDDSVPADEVETTTTVIFDLNETFPNGIPERVYFRVEK